MTLFVLLFFGDFPIARFLDTIRLVLGFVSLCRVISFFVALLQVTIVFFGTTNNANIYVYIKKRKNEASIF